MDLTKEEIDQLKQAKQVYKLHTLNRQQVEHTLHRKLTDKSWQAYVTSESRKLKSTKRPKEKSKPQFTFVAKHAAKKDKSEIYGTRTMSTELQNCSEKIKIITRLQLWRPELELVGISSGSWYHCLPIRTCL